ncbi:AGAP001648-PA-like protein [Anopheles sinensis]|uniref:CLIP domain-containing serine protease n=1 Tax=Anopheles sinensis TaxID=74873 RepID=A0A084WB21_ANOSI|nr:AGAP001648-PA-like protein [Anopheles sinensis]
MNTPRKTAADVLLFASVALVLISNIAASKIQGCDQSEHRCVPIRFCPLYHKQARTQQSNGSFEKQLLQLQCDPEGKIDKTFHVCCPKRNIECTLGNQPATCKRLGQCSSLSARNEHKWKEHSNATNLCYIHKSQNYICCPTDESDGRRRKRSTDNELEQYPSVFPACSHTRGAFLVPAVLCDCEYTMVRGSSKVCCKIPPSNLLISHPKAIALAQGKCGTILNTESLFTVRIHKGFDTDRGEYPWMVLLVYKANTKAFCAGTLIHPRYVLTAAHCVRKFVSKLTKVRVGEHNLWRCDDSSAKECSAQVQEIAIEKHILYKPEASTDKRMIQHDVALLKLQQPAELVPGVVEPICLPITRRLLMHLPSTLTITGWGKTEHDRPTIATNRSLLHAHIPVVQDSSTCREDYEFCAGGSDASNTCPGDSGGPYQSQSFYLDDKRYVQYGVISGGSRFCDGPDRASKAMLVSYYIPWILDMMDIV